MNEIYLLLAGPDEFQVDLTAVSTAGIPENHSSVLKRFLRAEVIQLAPQLLLWDSLVA